jgi:hypothetical protein
METNNLMTYVNDISIATDGSLSLMDLKSALIGKYTGKWMSNELERMGGPVGDNITNDDSKMLHSSSE